VRLGRNPVAMAMIASITTTRMAAANTSTSFGMAHPPDGRRLVPSMHLPATPPASKPCGWRFGGVRLRALAGRLPARRHVSSAAFRFRGVGVGAGFAEEGRMTNYTIQIETDRDDGGGSPDGIAHDRRQGSEEKSWSGISRPHSRRQRR